MYQAIQSGKNQGLSFMQACYATLAKALPWKCLHHFCCKGSSVDARTMIDKAHRYN